MKFRDLPVLLICLFFFISCANRPKTVLQQGSLDVALQKAKKENKFLLYISSIQKCGACQILIDSMEQSKDLQNILDKEFVLFGEIDSSTNKENSLSQLIGSTGFPNSFVFNPDGELISVLNKVNDVSFFHQELYNIINKRPVGHEFYIPNKEFSSVSKERQLKTFNLCLSAEKYFNIPFRTLVNKII